MLPDVLTHVLPAPNRGLPAALRGPQSRRVLSALRALFVAAAIFAPWQTASASGHCQTVHTVRAGDTIYSLSRTYGVTMGSIVEANNLSNVNRIYIGQRLCIPVTTPPACQAYHAVKRGETLSAIGRLYGVSWQRVVAHNNLSNPNQIEVGQVLCIPHRVSQPSPGTSIPTFSIAAVTRDQHVTIRTANFPANTNFVVRMGAFGTRGINGTHVTTINSGEGGSFIGTYNIPAHLRGSYRIAVRLESAAGYYSYNWFYNNSTN